MLRTYWSLEHLNPGFDRNHVVSFTLGMKDAAFTKPQARSYLTELQQRIRSIGGVRSVSYSFLGLLRGSDQKRTVTIARGNQPPSVFFATSALGVSPEYFATLGIPLLEGRVLSEQDRDAKPLRVVVNRALAKSFFPNTDPVGQLLISGTDASKPPAYQIVGVVETAKYKSLQEAGNPRTIYLPMEDEDYSAVVYVRTAGNPTDVMRPVQDAIRQMGGGVTLREAATVEQDIQNSLWQRKTSGGIGLFFQRCGAVAGRDRAIWNVGLRGDTATARIGRSDRHWRAGWTCFAGRVWTNVHSDFARDRGGVDGFSNGAEVCAQFSVWCGAV